MVDTKGLDKAEVLAALHRESKAQGMGILHDRGPLTVEQCRKVLAERQAGAKDEFSFAEGLYFDYLTGRVMKVDLSNDDGFDPFLYDRDNGPGAAERAVSALRQH
jgi:hypothetical protein